MRSRYHDATVELKRSDRKIERVGGDHSNVDDVCARIGGAACEGLAELCSRGTHIAADGHRRSRIARTTLGFEQRYEGAPDRVRDLVAQLGRINPADVVGFENRGVDSHSLRFFDRASVTPS